MRTELARNLAIRCTTAGLAGAAFLLLALTDATVPGAVLAATGVASTWIERRVRPRAELLAEHLLLTTGLLAGYAREHAGVDWLLLLTAAALLGLVVVERPLRNAGDIQIQAANLGVRSRTLLVTEGLGQAIPVLLLGLAATVGFRLPVWPVAAVAVLVGAACLAVVAVTTRRRLRPGANRGTVGRALRRHRPEFVLYFSAPPGSQYQVLMWLPYLERIGRPFFVLLREAEFLPVIAAATKAPVVLCPTVPALDEAIVPGLRVAFYVNHGAKNAHCVRFPQLTHIQIHHGDSDKSPSFSPVTAIFDKIFVAGQAAIDRYARNGVMIPREKFVIVGRPQVEAIDVVDTPVRAKTDPVVLYTPTWTGHYSDVNYCSLPIGDALVKALLARGTTVILRAHPYTAKNPESARLLSRIEETLADDRARTGRAHVWGAEASRKMSLADCVNRCDALVSDVSAVISDFLYSGKPFSVVDVVDHGERFADTFPLTRAGYVLRPDLSNVDATLDALLVEDPLEETRHKIRTEYLGDFPPEGYADVFVTEARRYL